jgi:hypothetical protein
LASTLLMQKLLELRSSLVKVDASETCIYFSICSSVYTLQYMLVKAP